MRLDRLQRNWNRLGRTDPLWAILSVPSKRGGRWSEEEFFATGRVEIDRLMRDIETLGIVVPRGAALDFGCGVGRLTQALAEDFDTTTGLDIAPAMIERARGYNRHGDRVRYVLHAEDHLPFSPGTFDLVYTSLVLQHIRPEAIRRYIAEFGRVLTPEGLAVFQVPAVRLEPEGTGLGDRARRAVQRAIGIARPAIRAATALVEIAIPRMEMNVVPRVEVEEVIRQAGHRLVAALPDGGHGGFAGFRYFVRR